MTLTKNDLIKSIQEEIGITVIQSSEIVEAILEQIKSSLEDEDDVLISGFGKFCVKDKNARKGRNPANGDKIILRARKVVTFKCSGQLKKKLNGICQLK